MKKKYKRFVPNAMRLMREQSPRELLDICNGCGQAGWKGKLVPNTVWGLSIKEDCNVHDFMYHVGLTDTDKKQGDRTLLNNMTRTVLNAGGWLERLRLWRIEKYYLAVKYGGGPAFWDGKNNPDEELDEKDAEEFFDFDW